MSNFESKITRHVKKGDSMTYNIVNNQSKLTDLTKILDSAEEYIMGLMADQTFEKQRLVNSKIQQ